MDGPAIELFQCQALKARISRQQCLINQEQARLRSEPVTSKKSFNGRQGFLGLLRFCLECTQKVSLAEQDFSPAEPVRREQKVPMEKQKMAEMDNSKQIMCVACGEPKSPEEMHRSHNKPSKYCLECVKAKRQEKWAAKTGKEPAQVIYKLPESKKQTLTIDFTGREDILECIRETADLEERTPQGQIMYWLKKHVRREERT